ncbi:MAG: DNA primase [Acidobacteria bacterium]|nr:DNA primase [Acidobacteriota bacterium]
MRYPQEFIEELKNQADIVRIIGDYITLKKKGQNYWACCPFHGEKTPSFSVSAAKGFFKCFGCGKAGTVFQFVMELEGSNFSEAVKTIAEKAGVALPVMTNDNDAKHYEERDKQRDDLRQLNSWATEFFESNLESGEGRIALEYLAKRGISDESRRQFRLGYAPNSWDALSSYLQKRGATKFQIERSGLVSLKDSGSGFYDKFRGRLMFPILDTQGKVVAFGGRILGEGDPKYLNSPETVLYTKGQHLFGLNYSRDAIRRQGFVILVEGYLDFLIPYQHGVRNLVASLGTALTDSQVRLLGRFCRKIIVNFDPDSAGVNATKRSLELLLTEGFKVNVLTLPDNLDPDEFIRERGAESYTKVLRSSQSFMDYIVEQAIKSHDQNSPAGKVETLNEILPYLKLVKDRVEASEQVERIADRLKLDSKLVREEFKRAVETRAERVSEVAVTAQLTVKPAEKRLLAALLNHAGVRQRILRQMAEAEYKQLRTAPIFKLLFELEQQGSEPTYDVLSERIYDAALVNDLLPELLMELAEKSEEAYNREAEESLLSLRSTRLAEQQAVLQTEINQAQREGNAERVNELLLLKFELAKQERALTNQLRP